MIVYEKGIIMKLLFCNIAWMIRYDGNEDGTDQPRGGGEYVERTGDAHEKYNFKPEPLEFPDTKCSDDYCLGFVETKSTNGVSINQLNIEKISGCENYKKEPAVEDVLVIYCAPYPFSSIHETYVVGWYKHAVVYRNYQNINFPSNDEEGYYPQSYNALAKSKDCVLLPENERRKNQIWRVPRKRKGVSFGFGQANVWFAQDADKNPKLQEFLDRIVKQIEEYTGEKFVDKNKCS